MLTVLSYFYNKKFNYSYLDKSIANYSIIVLALQLVVFLGFKYFNLKYQIYYLLPFNVFYITVFYKVLIKSSAQKSTKDILAHILIGILLICYVLQFSLAKTTFVEVYYIFYQIVLLVLLIKCLVKYLAVTKFETNPHVSTKWFFHSLVVLTVIEATLFFYNLISGLDLNDIQITSILYSSFVCTILLIFVIKAITGSETELQNIDKIVKPVVNSKESHIDDNLLDMLLTTKDGVIFKEGDFLSIDGATGYVYGEQVKTVEPEISGNFEIFMSWADSIRTLKVRANADTPRDAETARKFGAEGIGLCRTEHMFFDKERIFNFRRMIMSDTVEQREEALTKIIPYQRDDFEKLFEVMNGNPVIIRYLDPPLHEFLPHTDEEIKELAISLNTNFEALKERAESLREFNPMMGHRGCRLSVTYPEITRMQTKAVIEAAINVINKGINVIPEIMIPLIGDTKELKYVKSIVEQTANEIISASNVDLKYKIGTMIEVPRAVIIADKLALDAEFFSFGTNDLTQLTYGFSRDDAGKYLKDYYDKGIFESDPFARIDENGVGIFVRVAINKAKRVRPNIDLGICGEHGGEPSSIEFCHQIGLNYVSCSPFRVPVARLAAAQAAIKSKICK